ncbi:unnamed protein product [marine sediment metagenome]|uniref:Uncharacterized protein n=1 Tax=marine sediment metagenome TaxID=412755 RepID=X1AF04_9ZZZZ
MEESEKENLFVTFKGVIKSIILDKRRNPKNNKILDNFQAKLNMGLHTEEDFYLWVNLTAQDGKYTLSKGKLEEYDLEIIATPEDLMGFSSGENSTLHMMLKKNKYGFKKLRYDKSSDGKRNFGILLKLPKVLVLDKIQPRNE